MQFLQASHKCSGAKAKEIWIVSAILNTVTLTLSSDSNFLLLSTSLEGSNMWKLLGDKSGLCGRFCITSPQVLQWFIMQHAGKLCCQEEAFQMKSILQTSYSRWKHLHPLVGIAPCNAVILIHNFKSCANCVTISTFSNKETVSLLLPWCIPFLKWTFYKWCSRSTIWIKRKRYIACK